MTGIFYLFTFAIAPGVICNDLRAIEYAYPVKRCQYGAYLPHMLMWDGVIIKIKTNIRGFTHGDLNAFTLAEMHFQGWEAGKQNPVVYLVRMLRARGEFSADLRKWIRANTDNRYLPYGSAL
jgi:hypothetical protein